MGKIKLISAMAIFGTIGLFVRNIPLPSSVIALVRGAVGTIFLFITAAASHRRISGAAVRKNLVLLVLSGAAVGINWILLFEAYRYTTVATATLCYYLAPVFVVLLSPVVLKEKLTRRKLFCVIAALLGMAMISGVFQGGQIAGRDFTGILFGTGAAVFYAGVILMNKFLKDIPSGDSTMVQLGAAALVLLPYVLLTEGNAWIAGNVGAAGSIGVVDGIQTADSMIAAGSIGAAAGVRSTVTISAVLLLMVVGILHTGIAYRLYFSSVAELDGQTIAVFSYIDPVVAIILSALVLGEAMDGWGAAGAVLILGSTLYSEWKENQDGK